MKQQLRTIRLTIRISPALLTQIHRAAAENGLPRCRYIRHALRTHIRLTTQLK